MRLYEISKELERIILLVDREAEQNDGEVPELLEKELEYWQAKKDEKITNCAFLIKNLEGTVNAIDPEIKRLQALKATRVNKIERLKNFILEHIDDDTKIDLDVLKIFVRQSEYVEVLDEEEIPNEFIEWKKHVSKSAISRELKAGVAVPGAQLATRRNLQIK